MRSSQRNSRVLLLPGVASVVALALLPACGSGGGTGDDDDASVPSTGDDDASLPSTGDDDASAPGDDDDSSTPVPTPDWVGAHAFVVEKEGDLLTGPAARGHVGDIMMANDQMRVVIQAPGRDVAWGMYGGTIIDAAMVAPDGTVGEDSFGELSVFFNLATSMNTTSVRIEDDGATSGRAVVVAEGEDDIFDMLKLDAAVEPFGITLPYDLNQDFPLRIKTTYTMGPYDRHVHVTTEFFNDGEEDIVTPVGDVIDAGGDMEVYIPNPEQDAYSVTIGDQTFGYTWGGFAEAEYAIPDFIGYFTDGVSYGYVPPRTKENELNALQVTVSGVTVTVLGTTQITDVFDANPRDLFEIPAGESASIERDFVVARDIAGVTDEIYQLRDVDTGTLTGQVLEAGTGLPLGNVRIAVVKGLEPGAPVTAAYTGPDGRFQLELPEGDYGLMAMQGYDYTQDSRPAQLEPIPVSVIEDRTVEQNIELGVTGSVSITVVDGASATGSLLPARATFYGPYDTPPRALIDTTDDDLGEGVARLVWLPDGQATFDMKPGTYTVVVTRGFEYDLEQIDDYVVPEGGEAVPLTVTLTPVLDTSGFISADLHVHGINSPDSPVPQQNRVITFATEGVDVLVSTDHDYVTDYLPYIESLGLEPWITAITGIETTTFNMGHFNSFPWVPDPASRSAGALDWTDTDSLPVDPATGMPVEVGQTAGLPSSQDNLSLYQIFAALEATQPGSQVHHVNHARDFLTGYFTQIGLDMYNVGTALETSADPANFRLPSGTDLLPTSWITALEIQNGLNMATGVELMNDWFGFLNLGYRYAGTGVSDTHTQIASAGGYARTFVRVADDDPAMATLDPEFKEAFAQAINHAHATVGTGLFVTTEVTASNGATGGMGDLVTAPDGTVMLQIHVQAPPWASFETVEIFANPVVRANPTDSLEFETPADLDPQITLTAGADFDVTQVSVATTRPGGTWRKDAVIEVPFILDEDTWFVVSVRGSSGELYPGLNSSGNPFAFTNPIFVDADGDGTFEAPGLSHVIPADEETLHRPRPLRDRHGHLKGIAATVGVYRAEKAGAVRRPATSR